MDISTYDPDTKAASAFDMDNMEDGSTNLLYTEERAQGRNRYNLNRHR